MAELLVRLLAVVEVCVISGGNFAQFQTQLIADLPVDHPEALERMHVMPTCGTQYYLYRDGDWRQQYAENLTEVQKSAALAALEIEARRLGLWETETWGPILEDRGSQITFSALGQAAPSTRRRRGIRPGRRRTPCARPSQPLLPDLEVRSGGSTSVDITRRGIDKAYGMRKLAELTGVPFEQMIFVGDRLDPDGNDFPVIALGIPTVAVGEWHDTARYVEEFLAQR